MKMLQKIKKENGRRQILLFGMKIFSYKNRKKKVVYPNIQNTSYGKIYFPYYHPFVAPSNAEAEIYNKNGRRMRTFFLRDFHLSAGSQGVSQYFIWDKFNIGLDVHFYSHQAMLETMGRPKFKFGFFIETESIVPEDYKIFEKHPDLAKEFDLIFTNNKRIIDTLPNARFVPMNCTLYGGSFASEYFYKKKTKGVSILSSDKQMCPLHVFRYKLAHLCKNKNLCDTFGTFDGGPLVNIDETLRDYRFSICIENTVSPYLFSERLICAFANQTIPVYLGATEIDKFFNPNGIIKITENDDIEKVLKQCTKEEYERRLPAILDNYERAKQYLNPFDFMYEKYIEKFINAKEVA